MRREEFDLPYRSLDPPEPHIVGHCVFCEKDILQDEIKDTTLIRGRLAHEKCVPMPFEGEEK